MEVYEQLAAKRFVLVDDDGNPAALITGAKGGLTGFTVSPTREGGAAVSIGVTSEGGDPAITLLKDDGSAVLITLSSGGTLVQLKAADGTMRTITPKGDLPGDD